MWWDPKPAQFEMGLNKIQHTNKETTLTQKKTTSKTWAEQQGFWASSPPFPAMHLHVGAGSRDLLWLIQISQAAASCAVLSLIPRQVYLFISSKARLWLPMFYCSFSPGATGSPSVIFLCQAAREAGGCNAPALVLPPCRSAPRSIGLQTKWERNK